MSNKNVGKINSIIIPTEILFQKKDKTT